MEVDVPRGVRADLVRRERIRLIRVALFGCHADQRRGAESVGTRVGGIVGRKN
jgi:hypothetical protein